MLEQVYRDAGCFDLIHFHVDYLHYPMSRRHERVHLTTLHGRLDLPDLQPLYRHYADIPLVSISDAQRTPLPWVNWQGTVHHGLPDNLFTFRDKPGDYLAFLGRTSPEKGIDQAILIARRTRRKLKIAAKVDKADREYFEQTIEPMIRESRDLVEFLGEVGGKDKDEFLGNASALLFPIAWSEPFGLVMIEAMACGTPVIAYRRGSVPEVMEDGVTGLVVGSLEEAVQAVSRVPSLDRRACHRVFAKRFSATRMTADYLTIYRRLIEEHRIQASGNGRAKNRRGRHSIDKGPHAKVVADI
jgi:glycosyltransferase involved in cell wall biosynthesis